MFKTGEFCYDQIQIISIEICSGFYKNYEVRRFYLEKLLRKHGMTLLFTKPNQTGYQVTCQNS